ncbi:MAG: metallophosphoesterase [Aquisalinus sp.]|nr:metallophosphoesterase [Aquisalinus sp.]
MVNILHLSDLHYSKKNNFDQLLVLDSLKEHLRVLSDSNKSPDLIVFSGDLVHSADEEDIFLYLYDEVLSPILKITRCAEQNVILCSGNHDVHSSSVRLEQKSYETYEENFKDRSKLNNFVSSQDFKKFITDRNKSYLEVREIFREANQVYFHGLSELIEFPEYGLNFITINTGWLTRCGIKELGNDKNKLFYPEEALYRANKDKPDHFPTILVSHHPLNWLDENNCTDIERTAAGNFDLHLFGHMHEPDPKSITNMKGSCLSVQAGALYTGRKRYNGYSVISFDEKQRHTAVRLFSYFDTRREFDVAVDKAKKGIFFDSKDSEKYWHEKDKKIERSNLLKWMKNEFLPKAVDHFSNIIADKFLNEVFVEPNLTKHVRRQNGPLEDFLNTSEDQLPLTVSELVHSPSNFIIYGKQEFGRTTLLQKIALDVAHKSSDETIEPSVPVLISFNEIKSGNDPIGRLLRSSNCCEPDNFSLQQLIAEGKILILIDDVDFSDSRRMNIIRDFIKKNKNNRIICTTLHGDKDIGALLSNELIVDSESGLSFEHVFLHEFNRNKIRHLVANWGGNDQDNEDVINRITREFRQMNIPHTALNGTILLTLYESSNNYEAPINRSVLVERFIEYLLQKQSASEAFRGSFDFRNKTHILSNLAAHMCQIDQYALAEEDLISFFERYLNNIGLDENSSLIFKDFLESRILQKRPDGNVRFRYRFILEYFVACQMSDDPTFKDWILEEDHYLKFPNEIEYFAAKSRTDLNLINIISFRYKELFNDLLSIEEGLFDLNAIDNFELPSTDDKESIYDHLEAQLDQEPLSDRERDEILDADIPFGTDKRQEVHRPIVDHLPIKWLQCLFLYSGVLKNLEIIPNEDKKQHISHILSGWAAFMLISYRIIPALAERRHMRVNGVLYAVNAPKAMTEKEVARFLYVEMPNSFSNIIYDRMGTSKLKLQLEQPLVSKGKEPTIISYFRNYLATELKLGDWVGKMEEFSNTLPQKHVLKESLLKRVTDMHLLGTHREKVAKSMRSLAGRLVGDLRGHDAKSSARRRSDTILKLEKKALLKKLKMSSKEQQ